jgi:hypothetical protein
MSWEDYALARRHLTEQRIGTRVRDARRAEDAQANEAKEAMQRQERMNGPR